MKKIVRFISMSILCSIVFVCFSGEKLVAANEVNTANSEILYVTAYEVTNETISPGSDFKLTITIHNFSESVTASIAHVVLDNPDGVIPEYGKLSEGYIENVKPGSDVQLSFNYTADDAITAAYLDFTAHITTAKLSDSSKIRIPVGRATDFRAESVSVPKSFGTGKSSYVGAMVTNLGTKALSNVVMVVRSDDVEMASSKIGTMAAGTNKTQSVNLTFTKDGKHKLDFILKYTNADGVEKEYVIASDTVTVSKDGANNNAASTVADENNVTTPNAQSGISTTSILVLCMFGFLVIAVSCVVLVLIYKRK